MDDDTFLPYFAGFFDGEGSIGVYTNGNKHRGRTLRITITQNVGPAATELLQHARHRWGGALTLMNRNYKRPAWMWQVSGSNGAHAISDIRPWLRLKAEQADVALEYWADRRRAERDSNGRFLPLAEYARQQGCDAEAALKALKRGEEIAIADVARSGRCHEELRRPLTLW